ncbi:sensor histidine kinase [Allonocardiopsis opalescens]|uniref:sensor histidine kinase n=1 Tax=Allonocardiopsis opalescens TaxID=1144618 RepID=UPI001FE81D3C|nr:HAMP domain-containing sensor histidine kinase [Allonocardiopsis opalescens]
MEGGRAGPLGWWRRVPLWARLIVVTLALVAGALALTGFFGVQLLRGHLEQRVDQELLGTTRNEPPPLPPDLDGPQPRSILTLRPGAIVVWVDGGGVVDTGGAPPAGQSPPGESALVEAARTLAPGQIATLPAAVPGDYPWRAAASQAPSGLRQVVAYSLADVESTVDQLTAINLAIGAAVLAALSAAGFALVRVTLRPLGRIGATAEAIAAGDLSRRVPSWPASTEMGRLSRSLNGMLGQIERAFRAREDSERQARASEDRMRRFVADASHELRTPLTSISGYAQLYRQAGTGSGPAGRTDPAPGPGARAGARPGTAGAASVPDVPALFGRIEAEARRMGTLVDDLLLLARLDRHRPLERAPVDLFALAADAVLDARARDPDRPIELVRLDGPADTVAPVTVSGDETGLRQVLDNLVGNALTHTPPGTPVEVRVGLLAPPDGPGRAVVAVADQGPGISPELADRVFERFYRPDPARARGGAGLGLSIVAALVTAHGGTVDLTPAESGGSVFTVSLPPADGPPP